MFLSRSRNKRSNINLSHVKVDDIGVGTVKPLAIVPVVTGDVMRFQPSTFVQAMAMKAPLVNGFKLCLEYFFAPDRLYHGDLLLDESDVTDRPDQIIFPAVRPLVWGDGYQGVDMSVGYDGSGKTAGIIATYDPKKGLPEDTVVIRNFDPLTKVMVQPGSILDMMGIPVGWFCTAKDLIKNADPFPSRSSTEYDRAYLNVTPVVAYLDIFLNYYVNQNVDYICTSAYKVSADTVREGDGTSVWVLSPAPAENVRIRLVDLQSLVGLLKRSSDPSFAIQQWVLNHQEGGSIAQPGVVNDEVLMRWEFLCSPCSLFQRSQPGYYLESWLKTAYGDAIGNTVKVDVENESVSFHNVRTASHLQRFLELCMSGGTRYSDYMNAQFDSSRVKNSTTPIFLGADRQFLGSNIIYQTTGFQDGESPLGAFAGQANGGQKHKKRTFKFGENGTFFVMVSLVPDTIYYRGMNPLLRQIRLDDKYVPSLDNVGLEPLPVEWLDCLPPKADDGSTSTLPLPDNTFRINVYADDPAGFGDQTRAVGFVPAWSSQMNAVSRLHGHMQTDLKYWALARDYSGAQISEHTEKGFAAWLDAYFVAESRTKGGLLSRVDAFRAWLDNLRQSPLYTPYIQNHLYNSVFADTSVDARNFVVTLSMDISVNREKAKVNIGNTL